MSPSSLRAWPTGIDEWNGDITSAGRTASQLIRSDDGDETYFESRGRVRYSGARFNPRSADPRPFGFCGAPKRSDSVRTPNGHLLDTYIASFSLGKPIGGGPTIVAIELPSDIRRENVPIGTEVWFLLPNE